MYKFSFMTGREKRSGKNRGELMEIKYWKSFRQAVNKAKLTDVVVIQFGDITYPLKARTIKSAMSMDKFKTLEFSVYQDIFNMQLNKLGVNDEEFKQEGQDLSNNERGDSADPLS